MGSTTKTTHKNQRTESTFDGKTGFNSLETEAHVDPQAAKSTPHFDTVKKYIEKNRLDDISCRGLKYMSEGYNNDVLCQVEIVCESEKGLINLLTLMKLIAGKITFTYVRIMGDNFINLSNKDIKIG